METNMAFEDFKPSWKITERKSTDKADKGRVLRVAVEALDPLGDLYGVEVVVGSDDRDGAVEAAKAGWMRWFRDTWIPHAPSLKKMREQQRGGLANV
jgi:hypothetical protein